MYSFFIYLLHRHTHAHNISRNGDKTREYTRITTQKLHVVVNVTKQVINHISISHIINVRWLDNTECLSFFFFFFFFFLVNTHRHTYVLGKEDETSEYAHTQAPELQAAVSVVKQLIDLFLISHLTNVGWLDNTEYFFLVRRTHIHTHIYGKEDETVEYTYRPTTKLHAGLSVGNTPSQYHTLPKWDDFTTLCVFFIIYLLHTHTYTIYRRRWMRQGNALACQHQNCVLQLVSRSKW